jgi:hypothetical protein
MGKGPQPVDPKLLEKEVKPTMTVAMGMKQTHSSVVCWKTQIKKEQKQREDWYDLHRPGWREQEKAVIERVLQRDEERRAAAAALAERALLVDGVSKEGRGRAAYLRARHQLSPQEKNDRPETQSQTIGWKANTVPTQRDDDPWKRKSKNGGAYHRQGETEEIGSSFIYYDGL